MPINNLDGMLMGGFFLKSMIKMERIKSILIYIKITKKSKMTTDACKRT